MKGLFIMENESSIKEIIQNSLEQVRTIIDADTVMGKQIVTPSGTVIIPVSKVSMGFASGGLDLPTKIANEGGKKNFGGGGGTGVTVSPIGFLVVTPDGKVELIPMTTEKLTPVEQVAELIYNAPDIIGRVKNVFTNGYHEEKEEPVDRSAELEEIYRQKLAQEVAEPSEDVVEEAEQILYEEEEELTKEDKKRLKKEEKERKKQEKLEKKAQKKALKEAQTEEELAEAIAAIEAAQAAAEAEAAAAEAKIPVPHNKRGKISEKTLENGTIR